MLMCQSKLAAGTKTICRVSIFLSRQKLLGFPLSHGVSVGSSLLNWAIRSEYNPSSKYSSDDPIYKVAHGGVKSISKKLSQ